MFRESIAIVVGFALGVVADEFISGRRLRKTICKKEDDFVKFYEFYLILLQWIRVHQEGRTLVDYFKKNNYHSVAIYGMKELGEALLEELEGSDIDVKYGIDRSADSLYVGVDTYKPDEDLEDVDAVVVTAVHFYDDIEEQMKEKVKGDIVSIEDVVWEA